MTKDNKDEKDTESERQLNYEEDRKYTAYLIGPSTVYRLTEHSQKEDDDDDEEV